MSIRSSLKLAPSPFASSSRLTLPLIHARLKATKAAPAKAPVKGAAKAYDSSQGSSSESGDARVHLMRRVLYPPGAYNPRSASPTGTYPPKHLEKLHAVIQHPEVHETIERAWKLHRRQERLAQQASMQARFNAMEEACDELHKISRTQEDGTPPLIDRQVYEQAVARADPHKEPRYALDRKASELDKWKDARINGLMPREIWVPTETKGSAWKYEWQRPAGA